MSTEVCQPRSLSEPFAHAAVDYWVHNLAKTHWSMEHTRRLIDQLDHGKVEQEREEQNWENIQYCETEPLPNGTLWPPPTAADPSRHIFGVQTFQDIFQWYSDLFRLLQQLTQAGDSFPSAYGHVKPRPQAWSVASAHISQKGSGNQTRYHSVDNWWVDIGGKKQSAVKNGVGSDEQEELVQRPHSRWGVFAAILCLPDNCFRAG